MVDQGLKDPVLFSMVVQLSLLGFLHSRKALLMLLYPLFGRSRITRPVCAGPQVMSR